MFHTKMNSHSICSYESFECKTIYFKNFNGDELILNGKNNYRVWLHVQQDNKHKKLEFGSVDRYVDWVLKNYLSR
jgi:hypothetical protein